MANHPCHRQRHMGPRPILSFRPSVVAPLSRRCLFLLPFPTRSWLTHHLWSVPVLRSKYRVHMRNGPPSRRRPPPSSRRTDLLLRLSGYVLPAGPESEGRLTGLYQVYVEGHNIPPNAVVAGDERGKPLYVARTFFEGTLRAYCGACHWRRSAHQSLHAEIGKAGHHLKLGASIPLKGREVDVSSSRPRTRRETFMAVHIRSLCMRYW